jgi:hypothetical protein
MKLIGYILVAAGFCAVAAGQWIFAIASMIIGAAFINNRGGTFQD